MLQRRRKKKEKSTLQMGKSLQRKQALPIGSTQS